MYRWSQPGPDGTRTCPARKRHNRQTARNGLEPALQLIPDLIQEINSSGEYERLSQQHQMLMSIQFPNGLVVTNFVKVEIGDTPEVDSVARKPAKIITSPIDLGAGFNLESKQ